MVIPERVGDQIHILLNNAKVTEYTQDGSMTWVGTIAHEYTHALDFDGIAQQDRLDSYSIIEQGSKYSMFHQWTEYKRASTILCSQFDIPGWRDKLVDPILADAICDRIVHDSYTVIIAGQESMRKRKGLNE